MKKIIYVVSWCLLLGCNKKDLAMSSLTYDEALSQQLIEYDFQDRHYLLTEITNGEGAFFDASNVSFGTEKRVRNLMEGLSSEEGIFSRSISAAVPNEQSGESHFETFGLHLYKKVTRTSIDNLTDKYISNENFQTDFLSLGKVSMKNKHGQISYHQTYLVSDMFEDVNATEVTFTEIKKISDKENAFFVSGTFETFWEASFWKSNLTNGEFKLVIEN